MRAECSDQVMVGGSVQAGIVSLHHHARPARAGRLSQHASTGHPLQPSRVRPLARKARAKAATAAGEIQSALTTRRCSRPPSAQALRSRYSGMWKQAAACAGVSRPFLGTFIANSRLTAADHRLTKILVLA